MDRDSPWGMVLHTNTEWDVSELHKGGVAWLRGGIPWDALQPQAGGSFNWLPFDRLVRWVADRGVWLLAGLGGTPEWAVDPARLTADGHRYRPSSYPPKNLADWDNYVTQVLTRYGSRVCYWGIWNEPDSFNESADVCFWRGTQQEFFDGVLTRAVNVIRGFGPDHKVCVPDLAKADALYVPWRPHWLQDLLTKFGPSLHAATVHVYRGNGDGSDVIAGAGLAGSLVESYNSHHGTQIELWITETGWHIPDHTEAVISQKVQDLCNVVRQTPWVKKVFPYVWSDDVDSFSFKSFPRMTRQQWEGYKAGIRAPQAGLPLERDSLVVSHNLPAQMSPGQSYDVHMTLRNVGRWAWPKQGSIRLGFGSRPTPTGQPYSVKIDISDGRLLQVLETIVGITAPFRVQVTDRAPVAINGETTFSFRVTAPAQAGCHLIGWCMVDDNPADAMFFGQGLLQRLFVL